MKTRIVLIGLFSGLLFGIATPFNKIILEELNSFQLAGLMYRGLFRTAKKNIKPPDAFGWL